MSDKISEAIDELIGFEYETNVEYQESLVGLGYALEVACDALSDINGDRDDVEAKVDNCYKEVVKILTGIHRGRI